MTFTDASAYEKGFEIQHRTLGSIVLERMPNRREAARGRLSRTGQPVVAVLTHSPPSSDVLNRLAGLDHPDLVEWFGICEVGDSVISISAMAEGGSLLDRDGGRRLDEPEVARLVVSMAGALGALAEKGLSHGDLSPSNIVLTADGQPLLADLHDCVIADGAALTRATPGFEGLSRNSTPGNDLSALGQLVDYLAHGEPTWSSKAIRDAVEHLARGDALTETVTAALRDESAPRIETVEPTFGATAPIGMITRHFGPRPARATASPSDPSARRVFIGAAVLCAALTGAVLWAEQPPGCEHAGCSAEQGG